MTPGTAHYVAAVTVTQGAIDLCCDASGHDQVFASSGSFDLGYLGQYQTYQDIYLTPLAGPTAKWSITVNALPVILSGLKFNAPYLRPKRIGTISYHVDGDVTLSAMIKGPAGLVVRTLASNISVKAGDNELTWDGLDAAGSPARDRQYTVAISYLDAAGNLGSGTASVEVDGTPPTATAASKTIQPTGKLVINIHDALSGVESATLYVDGAQVHYLSSGSQFDYAPSRRWSPGRHNWNVTATDKVGNTGESSGAFTTPGCRVPRLLGRTAKKARAAIVRALCSVGRISHARSRSALRGRVIAQHPHAGLPILPEHSRVSFTIGTGRR